MDPADHDYARELLGKADMQSHLPLDYVKTAELYIDGLGDKHYAKDLLEQAEELCFEVAECAAGAHGYALIG